MDPNEKESSPSPSNEPRWTTGSFSQPRIESNEVAELLESRCSRCNLVTDKLYRMGTWAAPMTICSVCRSEFVGE